MDERHIASVRPSRHAPLCMAITLSSAAANVGTAMLRFNAKGLPPRLARISQTRLGICRVEPLSGGDGGDWVTLGRFGPELIV